jgi:hypothetical protein
MWYLIKLVLIVKSALDFGTKFGRIIVHKYIQIKIDLKKVN